MTRHASASAVLLVVAALGVADAQSVPSTSRADALVGLARTARDQGRHESAASHFREADRLSPLTDGRLMEFFWAAHTASAPDAAAVGARVLAANPLASEVRDALIGLAAARDEERVRELAIQGRTLEPQRALWPRRLAESALRSGRYQEAARHFLDASGLTGAEAADRAQWAMATELTGDKALAVTAWANVAEALWSSRPEWAASRERAHASIARRPAPRSAAVAPPPPVAPPSARDIVARSTRALRRAPCEEEPLRALEGLRDSGPFLEAVAGRDVKCPAQGEWTARAVERAIAEGAFERALALAAPAATADGALAVREQYGVLLHWLGRHAEAELVLSAVVANDDPTHRAVAALVEARRALGDADGAWAVASVHWADSPTPGDRVTLAELALETGRPEDALSRARGVAQGSALAARARAVEGGALLALGQTTEARTVLDALMPAAGATLAWLDAVAATEGVAAALDRAQSLSATHDAAWADISARRAVWQVRLGHPADAARLLAEIEASDPFHGQLVSAEMALASGRPADAEATLTGVVTAPAGDLRVLDGLSTALAEQGRWDEAMATLATLRARRPHDVGLAIREAEWRHRQAPGPASLAALEAVVRLQPRADGRSALARALFRSGAYTRAIETLGAPNRLADHDLVLLARSLRAAGRSADALAALGTRRVPLVEALILRAELDVDQRGPAAADATFAELTRRPDADPGWYLAWADLQKSGGAIVRVLEEASRRFPADATVQERLALAAWAERNRPVAARAADLAIAADESRTGAWFVKVEVTSRAGDSGALEGVLTRFESRFAAESPARIGMAEMLAGLARSPYDAAALRALGWMDGLLAREPTHTTGTVARARLLAALGRIADALSAIDGLVAARPDVPAALKLRAEVLVTVARYEDAVDAYDRYLMVVPGDVPARRQQARIEGWRGAFGRSLDRYEALCRQVPDLPAVAEEAAAKRAYYQGRWGTALAHYDAWLALEPDDVEAALERAQVYDHLGQPQRAAEAFRTVAVRVAPNDVALTAADRLDRRRQASVDLFATAQSADAAARRQLLDLVDTGGAYADDFGLGYGTRARVYGGPSMADGGARSWRGHHVGAELASLLTSALGVSGSATYRRLGTLEGEWFGHIGLAWRLHSSLRVAAAAERSLLLENGTTLEQGISAYGPTMSARWTPSADFSLQVSGAWVDQSDDNRRETVRVAASERLLRGTHELHVVGSSERLAYREARDTYFTPSAFWRHDVGAEWRGWLATPRFFGDRERWISATYLFGVDNRSQTYHTGRLGISYELASGIGLVADGQVIRSRVYKGARIMLGLRLRQVSLPRP